MPPFLNFTKIDNYMVRVPSGDDDPTHAAAVIGLLRTDNSVFAALYFYRAGIAMRPNTVEFDSANASYRLDMYEPILDLLRNEKPVFFQWMDLGGPAQTWGFVSSFSEPVGEHEGI